MMSCRSLFLATNAINPFSTSLSLMT
jgi:hypothetical protein